MPRHRPKALGLTLFALLLALAPAARADTSGGSAGTGGVVYSPGPSLGSETLGADTGGIRYDRRLEHPAKVRKRRLRRRQRAVRVTPTSVALHAFPVAGTHSLGGPDARFGARRPGHRHQGQDITAAAGTPVAAPRGGTITWRAFQAKGAGYYLVLDAVDEPYNYVFMHLLRGSVLVRMGDRVRTGQQLAQVGSTGESSGPHLHFEIWDGPWYNGGVAIDPLPFLLAWGG
jgi:murein DD-endopeptidase MepM/ murein hydrolase activator NlpD